MSDFGLAFWSVLYICRKEVPALRHSSSLVQSSYFGRVPQFGDLPRELCNVEQFFHNMSSIIVVSCLLRYQICPRAPWFKVRHEITTEMRREKVFIMVTDLGTCHPGDGIEVLNRLPGLAEPLLQIDLERELQELRLAQSWLRETGRSSKTLAKYPDFRIVLILMKGGTRMRQHRAEGRVSIQQLKGQVCIHLAHGNVNMSTGHMLVLDCGVLHDVEALEECALLLTISWGREKNDAREPFSSTQQHLDEEAVARMDDEGGAPEVA
jgi:quercetin dioxygenase-like cupin family protein